MGCSRTSGLWFYTTKSSTCEHVIFSFHLNPPSQHKVPHKGVRVNHVAHPLKAPLKKMAFGAVVVQQHLRLPPARLEHLDPSKHPEAAQVPAREFVHAVVPEKPPGAKKQL